MTQQRMIDLGGYRLALDARGEGSPPVVFVSGTGGERAAWQPVLDRIESATELVTYDRAGCGDDSDRFARSLADKPQPVSWAAEQLHTLLERAGIAGPVVLVGHSIGRLISDAYAAWSPGEVGGLVLVDTTDPDYRPGRSQDPEVITDSVEPGGLRIDLLASKQEFHERPPRDFRRQW